MLRKLAGIMRNNCTNNNNCYSYRTADREADGPRGEADHSRIGKSKGLVDSTVIFYNTKRFRVYRLFAFPLFSRLIITIFRFGRSKGQSCIIAAVGHPAL